MWAVLCALVISAPALGADGDQAHIYYIAGNPDCYPMEYYDAEQARFCGVLPTMFADLSASGGVEFRYLEPSADDRRLSYAADRQTEIISAILAEEEARYAGLLELSGPVIDCAIDGRIIRVRVGFTDIAPEAVVALVSRRIAALTERDLLDMIMAETLERPPDISPTQRTLLIGLSLALVAVVIGAAASAVIFRRRLRVQKRDHYQDPSSGMGNRVYFDAKYHATLNEDNRSAYCLLVMSLDIARVEQYESHSSVNQLLWQLGETFLQLTGEQEFFARIDDDVFALVVVCVSQQALDHRVEELNQALYPQLSALAVDNAVRLRYGACFLDATDVEPGATLRKARRALQLAVDGNKLLEVCDHKMLAALNRESELRKMITTALTKEEFIIYYQPIVNAADKSIAGLAALVRWQHAKEGMLAPDFYIPILEKDDMIAQLDYYVLRKACRFIVQNRIVSARGMFIKVNVSRRSIGDPRFLENFHAIIAETGVDVSVLVIDITKYDEAENVLERENLRALIRMGIRIFMDGFRSGFAPLSDLREFGFSGINMRRPILDALASEEGKQFVNKLIQLGHAMHMKLVCTGIETGEQAAFLQQAGCDYLQGFYFSYELPESEAEKVLMAERGYAN